MDRSPPGSTVHGISKARILECVAISYSWESSGPRDWTHVSCLAGVFFTTEPPGKPHWRTTALYFLLNSAITHILRPVLLLLFFSMVSSFPLSGGPGHLWTGYMLIWYTYWSNGQKGMLRKFLRGEEFSCGDSQVFSRKSETPILIRESGSPCQAQWIHWVLEAKILKYVNPQCVSISKCINVCPQHTFQSCMTTLH